MARPGADLPELGSDADDDEALRYAIALSLQDHESSATPAKSSKPVGSPKRDAPQVPGASGVLALDRRKMEEERLQRLAKRRRPASDDDDVVEVPPPKRKFPPALKAHGSETAMANTVPFPHGVVKRTWARSFPRSGDDIKIEEVLQKDKLQLAVLSSFQWDDEWILSKLDISKTKLLLVAFATDDAQKEKMRGNAPSNIKFCFPPMNGPGSMHSKLQLLKFPHYLRVVIPTGNLVPHDWGETGVMENMVFLIDLPRLGNSSKHEPTMFSTELGRFLEAAGVDGKMVDSLNNYDVSKTARLGFVYTVPGGHLGESRKRIGYAGLGASVTALGLASTKAIEIDLVCASLGAVNSDLVRAIYNACEGDNGMKEFNARKPASKATGTLEDLKERMRIYFPTNQTVSTSRGGRPAGGTICVQAKWWRAPSFPKELVRDCVNTRDGLLMHSKMIFVRKARRDGASSGAGDGPSWAYVGSANLSESAWGRLVKDRASGQMKMSCRNWECGVVIPAPPSTAERKANGANEIDDMSVFGCAVPVPMKMPGRKYEPEEEPWFFMNG